MNTHVLENKTVRLELDAKGQLLALTDKMNGHNYAGSASLWRLYFQQGNKMDREILGSDATPVITRKDDALELHYASVVYLGKSFQVELTIRVRLVGDETRWSVDIANHENDIILRECQFPLVHGLRLAQGQELLWSHFGGQKIADVRAEIRKHFTYYKASDHNFLHMETSYPCNGASMNCYTFAGQDSGLYCACHDDTFENTCHIFRLYKDELECGFARYPSLATGESASIGEFILAPHAGGWHVSAKKYRAWAENWYRPQTPPEWVRKMKGWQRIIMKHQYGEVHYTYHDLPQIHQEGLEGGIDALHMFGWWPGGMDNSNPDYDVDPELGGEDVMKKNTAEFQKNGAVILYSNGRLIDLDTDYYKTVGHRISIKDKFGAEIRDAYRFRANGTYTGQFGNRTFTAACPCCEEWFEKMKEVIDTAARMGCKGVFFDQLGYTEFPCHDPSHGHKTPEMRMAWHKAELTRRLREYTRQIAPGMGIGVEWLSDVCAQQCDFIHSCPGFASVKNDWERTGEKPVLNYYIDWFRYAFPEIIMTDREIRDDTDIERRVNHAILLGLRSDVEIYRCRKTIVETPHYCAYLKKANELRDRYSDFLLEGTYTDTDGFTCNNPEVEARAYVSGNRMAVVATQSHLASAACTITATGYRFVENGGLGKLGITGNSADVKLNLPRHGLAVLVYEKVN